MAIGESGKSPQHSLSYIIVGNENSLILPQNLYIYQKVSVQFFNVMVCLGLR